MDEKSKTYWGKISAGGRYKKIAFDPLDHLLVEMPLDANVLGESVSANDVVAPSHRYIFVHWGKGVLMNPMYKCRFKRYFSCCH